MKKNGWMLLEVITISSLLMLVFAICGQLYVAGWIISRDAIVEANRSRLIGMAVRWWPETVRNTKPKHWVAADTSFFAGQNKVERSADHLTFADGDDRRSVNLPAEIGCEFVIERNAVGADCAVMLLHVPERYYRHTRTNTLRVVACGGSG